MQVAFELELLSSLLELLYKGSGGEVTNSYASLGKAVPNGSGQVGLANAAGTEQQ